MSKDYVEIHEDETLINLALLEEIRSGLVVFGGEAVGETVKRVDELIQDIKL